MPYLEPLLTEKLEAPLPLQISWEVNTAGETREISHEILLDVGFGYERKYNKCWFLFTRPNLWGVDVRGTREWSTALGLLGPSGENDIEWLRESYQHYFCAVTSFEVAGGTY